MSENSGQYSCSSCLGCKVECNHICDKMLVEYATYYSSTQELRAKIDDILRDYWRTHDEESQYSEFYQIILDTILDREDWCNSICDDIRNPWMP